MRQNLFSETLDAADIKVSVAYLPVFKVTIECLILFQQALCKEMRLSCLPKKSMEGER